MGRHEINIFLLMARRKPPRLAWKLGQKEASISALHFRKVLWKGSAACRPGGICELSCCQVPYQPPAGLPCGPASQNPDLAPSECLPALQTWKSSYLQKIPVHQGFRRETHSFFAKNEMPHPLPYRMQFKPFNPTFKAIHELVIPELPTL